MSKRLIRMAAVAGAFALGVVTTVQAAPVRWKLHSTYPKSMPFLGAIAWDVAATTEKLTSDLRITVYDPGALVGATGYLDSVSKGAIDAALGSPGFHAGKNPAFNFVSAIPFGPSAPEFIAWMVHGGGAALAQEMYSRDHNVHYLFCGMAVPETNAWMREEIKSLDQLRGKKMRYFGLGGKVMEQFGVSTQQLAPGEIYQALELGVIDGTEFSNPAVDRAMGFHQVAKHAYFPGWHQQYTALELIVNKDAWAKLSDAQRTALETSCQAQITKNIAAGEVLLTDALIALKKDGVQIHRWSDGQLAQFEKAWQKVVQKEVEGSEDARKVWKSLSDFREKYRIWKEAGTIN